MIGYTIAYIGTLYRMTVEARGLIVPVLLANAASFILFHTHPSGDPTPSAEDLALTRRIAEAAALVGLALADHIILGEEGAYCSLCRRPDWPVSTGKAVFVS